MTTDVALKVDGMSLAEAMGISTGGGGSTTQSSLARVNQVHSALTVTDAEGDDVIKVPVGAYKVTLPDGEVVYSKTISTRIFSQRHQWQKWDAEAKAMHKTLLAANLNADLKDTTGRFNLGRPSGYIKDFQSLPEEMKTIIRSVKRVRVMLGVLKLDKPTDDMGNAINGMDAEMPFVMDVKNNESMKAMDAAINQIISKKLTPVEHTLKLGSAKRDLPSGGKYAIIVPSLGEQVPYGSDDSSILQDFIDWIKGTNTWIEGKHTEASDGRLSAADAEMVGSIVEVREFEG
jgi:hypothetical protein|tara:strand:+ start:739 stop:1605 length:867 start_codon:yes stop_codon:yes gene_type:complete